MRSRLAMLLAIAAVCVVTAWAGWSSEEQVTTSKVSKYLRWNNGHKVVVATNGVRHVVWFTSTGVFYKRFYPTTGWTSEYQFTTVKSSSKPSIALDANGTDIHVVWSGAGPGRKDHRHIYYQKCVPGPSGNGGWVGSPRDISGEALGLDNEDPSVASYQGHVGVTWWGYASDSVGFNECINGNWESPRYFVNLSGTGAWARFPSIAVDPQGRYGDVFITTQVNGSGVYVIRRQGGTWQAPECVFVCSYVKPVNPTVEVDPSTGYPHIFCLYGVDALLGIYHTYWDPSLGWQPLEAVSLDAQSIAWGPPSTIFNGSSAFVVWQKLDDGWVPGIMYSVGQYGNWSAPDWVTSGYSDEWPSVAARSNGDVFVVWQDGRTSNTQIWGRLYTPGSGGGQAEVIAGPQSGIELFPNPTRAGRVTVQYSLPQSEPLKVTLLDVSGRSVKTQEFALTDSRGSVAIDVRGLNAGVYVMRFESGTTSQNRKLVVQ